MSGLFSKARQTIQAEIFAHFHWTGPAFRAQSALNIESASVLSGLYDG